jgi:hypothetical protein
VASDRRSKRPDPLALFEQVTEAEVALVRQIVGPTRSDSRHRVWLGEVKRRRNEDRGVDKQMSGRPAKNEDGVVFLLATADLWHARTQALPTGGAIPLSPFEVFACEVGRKLDVPMPALRARRGAIKIWKKAYALHVERNRSGRFAWYPL